MESSVLDSAHQRILYMMVEIIDSTLQPKLAGIRDWLRLSFAALPPAISEDNT